MNTEEYIESGILEAYVLDTLSEKERSEVEANIAMYPELKTEVFHIEEAMLKFADAGALEPPAFLQNEIWNAVAGDSKSENSTVPQPVPTKTIPLNPAPEVRPVSWQRAAVWVALASSVLTNFLLLGQRNEAKNQQVAMQQSVDSLAQVQQKMVATLNDYKKQGDMVADSATQTIVMHTLKPGHPMAATVYWTKSKEEAYVSIEKLPMPPKGMQYQMWVIQNGKPVSMGVLPNDMVTNGMADKVNMQVMEGQAFAISLEKEGGNPTPTAENIYVLGKVSS